MTGPETFAYDVDERGCWIWSRYCDPNGYARIYNRDRKRVEWAHRYSYELHVGPIKPRHEIDHMCEVTNCVNPEHLQQVTKAEHVRLTMQRLGKDDIHKAAAHLRRLRCTYAEIAEALRYSSAGGAALAVQSAIRKGLISADDLPEVSRLTDSEREEIAALVAMGIPQGVVAELFRIHNSQVSRVARGLTSGHASERGVA